MTNYAKGLIARQRTQAQFPYLIAIEHEELGNYYYTNSAEDIIFEGQTYTASTFSVQPPEKNSSSIGNASLTISAVDQFWIEKIRSTQKVAKLHFMAKIKYNGTGAALLETLEENTFALRKASWNDVYISWEMVFDEIQTYVFNNEICNSAIAPGVA